MKKEGLRKEILRILTFDTDNLQKKKKCFYFLIYMLFYAFQILIISYMVFFLSRERPYLGVLALIYLYLLFILYMILNKRKRKES